MFDRVQKYLETLSRIPTDEEVQDMLKMSRRGFFGATTALIAAPYFVDQLLKLCSIK